MLHLPHSEAQKSTFYQSGALDTGLSALSQQAFPGDVAITGAPLGGMVRDLNVMVQRGCWRAEVHSLPDGGAVGHVRGADVAAIIAVAPQTIVVGSGQHRVAALDAVLFGNGADEAVTASASAIAVGLWRLGAG